MTETSTGPSPLTLEQRLTNLERELWNANERVRALSARHQMSARVRVFAAVGLTLLLLVFAWIVPVPAAAPTTFTAPVTVKSARTNARVVIDESGGGLGLSFFNPSGGLVLSVGLTPEGTGKIKSATADGSIGIAMGISPSGQPALTLGEGGKIVANLGTKNGNGYFALADKGGVLRLEAGTEQNGDGAVKVYGPTGKCGVALAGISCMIVAR